MKKIIKKISKLLNYFYVLIKSKGDFIILNAWIEIKYGKIEKRNFGDELNYYMLSELTGKQIAGYYNICHLKKQSDLMFIGSLVEDFTTPNSIIWGSGAISGDKPLRHAPKRVCAVRGKLTRQYLLEKGVNCPEVYGDPALLLPHIYKSDVCKKYKVGFIPHIHDLNSSIVKRISKLNKVHLIRFNNYQDWHDIIDEINECEIIISSSLHGIIISDAYNIPNVWIKLSDRIEGGSFKFLDYFSAVNRNTKQPLCVNEKTTLEDIVKEAKSYVPIHFDIKPLIAACPIKIKLL